MASCTCLFKSTKFILVFLVSIHIFLGFITHIGTNQTVYNSNESNFITHIGTNQTVYDSNESNFITHIGTNQTVLISNDSNPICQLLFPSVMETAPHHKTGVRLHGKIMCTLCDYCGIRNTSACLHLNKIQFRNPTSPNDMVKFHFWRDPVLTIVSGFIYHMTCVERWASRNLSTEILNASAVIFNYPKDPIALNAESKALRTGKHRLSQPQMTAMQKYRNWTKTQRSAMNRNWRLYIRDIWCYYANDVINQINLKHYGNYYGFNIDFDDQMIHQKYNIFRGNDAKRQRNFNMYNSINQWYSKMFSTQNTTKYGLYFEMLRYLFFVYPKIYDVHHGDHRYGFYELKMENWQNNFDLNLNIMLDALNFIDSVENRKTLQRYGFSHIDIQNERSVLTKQLQLRDPNREQEHMEHIHITRNDTKYYHELLTLDMNICLLMKHITNIIHYGWKYWQYC